MEFNNTCDCLGWVDNVDNHGPYANLREIQIFHCPWCGRRVDAQNVEKEIPYYARQCIKDKIKFLWHVTCRKITRNCDKHQCDFRFDDGTWCLKSRGHSGPHEYYKYSKGYMEAK